MVVWGGGEGICQLPFLLSGPSPCPILLQPRVEQNTSNDMSQHELNSYRVPQKSPQLHSSLRSGAHVQWKVAGYVGTCRNGTRKASRNPGLAQEAMPRTGSQGDAEPHLLVCRMLGSACSKKSSWGRRASEPGNLGKALEGLGSWGGSGWNANSATPIHDKHQALLLH